VQGAGSGAQPIEVSQLVSECVSGSVGEPINQSGGLSAKYSNSQSAGQLVIWLVSQSDRQSFCRTVDVSVNLAVIQPNINTSSHTSNLIN